MTQPPAPVSTIGRHALCELWGAHHLDDEQYARKALLSVVEAGNLTLVDLVVHRFSPQGVSAVAVLAESHLSLHTWPERSYAAVDFYTCGDHVAWQAILPALNDAFAPDRIEVHEVTRGLPEGLHHHGPTATTTPPPPSSRTPARYQEDAPISPLSGSYLLGEHLATETSAYQRAEVFTSPGIGTVLALDGTVQHTDCDTFAYHEVLAHPALCAHPHPRRVAIVGGGDLHLAAEVLRHDTVDEVLVLELDEMVVRLATRFWPTAARTLADPRTRFVPGDAHDTLAAEAARVAAGERAGFDVILLDLTDPVGPAERLFTEDFYRQCAAALTADGLVAAQTESIHLHPQTVRDCRAAMAAVFDHTALAWTAMATYPGAFWTFTLGAKTLDPRIARRTPALTTRLYDPAEHAWFFVPEAVTTRLLG